MRIAPFVNAKISPDRATARNLLGFFVGNIEIFGKVDDAKTLDVFDRRDRIEEQIGARASVDVGLLVLMKRRGVSDFFESFDFLNRDAEISRDD